MGTPWLPSRSRERGSNPYYLTISANEPISKEGPLCKILQGSNWAALGSSWNQPILEHNIEPWIWNIHIYLIWNDMNWEGRRNENGLAHSLYPLLEASAPLCRKPSSGALCILKALLLWGRTGYSKPFVSLDLLTYLHLFLAPFLPFPPSSLPPLPPPGNLWGVEMQGILFLKPLSGWRFPINWALKFPSWLSHCSLHLSPHSSDG